MAEVKLTGLTVFPEALAQVINEPRGGVEQNLTFWAIKAQNRARELLSSPYPGPRSRNPPPGPPKKRSGDLVSSVHVGSTSIGSDGLIQVPVVSASVHRGFNYSRWLLENNYEFIRPDQIR